MMSFAASVFDIAARGPLAWSPAPAPKKGPFFVRSKGSDSRTIHADDWLLKEIHGGDYEWAWPAERVEPHSGAA